MPGYHKLNGREWFTTCEPYSQTVRCRTDIWATQVSLKNGVYVHQNGWVFNNLTYLPLMTRAQWIGNPLGANGTWVVNGRTWRTECDTAQTGRNACRSYLWSNPIVATPKTGGGYTYSTPWKWAFNNIVRFKA